MDRIDDDGQDEIDVDDFKKSDSDDDPKDDVIGSFIDGVVDDGTDNRHKNITYVRGDDDDNVGGECNNNVVRGGSRDGGNKSDTHPSGGELCRGRGQYQRDDEDPRERALSKDASLLLRESTLSEDEDDYKSCQMSKNYDRERKLRGSSHSSTLKKGFSLSKSLVCIGRGRSGGRKEGQTNAKHQKTMEKTESKDTSNNRDGLVPSSSKLYNNVRPK